MDFINDDDIPVVHAVALVQQFLNDGLADGAESSTLHRYAALSSQAIVNMEDQLVPLLSGNIDGLAQVKDGPLFRSAIDPVAFDTRVAGGLGAGM